MNNKSNVNNCAIAVCLMDLCDARRCLH